MINEHFGVFAISYGMFHGRGGGKGGITRSDQLKNMDAVNPLYMWLSTNTNTLTHNHQSTTSLFTLECSTFIIRSDSNTLYTYSTVYREALNVFCILQPLWLH